MKKSFCIAIDGPSSSGKSTVAKAVAKELGFFHIDSGAIYRALAFWMEGAGSLDSFDYHVVQEDGKISHFVGDRDVTEEIRMPHISQKSSEIAVLPLVRQKVNELQRKIALGKSVVIEGRDIGSVVFPQAEVKIFLTANHEERARRRFKELSEKGISVSFEEVESDLLRRDERDRTRKDAPLIQAEDAHVIDTTDMSIGDVACKIVLLARKKRGVNQFWKWLVGEGRAHASFVCKVIWSLAYGFLKIFYRIEVKGLENYPKGAAIIAPNHASFLDPPAIAIACPGEVHFLAHVYLFKNPILRWILPRTNTHPVAGDGNDLSVLKKIAEFLMRGKQVVIFPEGSRSYDNQIAPLKRGVALLASMTKCRVVPVYISGAYEAWPRKKKFPKLWGKIYVVFGKPLEWKDYEKKGMSRKESQALFTKDLEEQLKALGGKVEIRIKSTI